MPAVRARPISALAAGGALALAVAASPAAAQAPAPTTSSTAATATPPTTTTTPTAAPAKVFLKVSGKGARIPVGGRVKAKGRIRPFVPGQRVELRIARNGKVLRKQRVAVKPVAHSNLGRFRIRSGKIIKPGPYRVTALHAATAEQGRGRVVSKPIAVHYPDLDPGQTSASVKVLSRLLAHQGYYTPRSRHYGSGVARAVLAYRKVNRMPRTMNATPGIFHTLAKGGGAFKPRYPGAGYHVEVDISRQVMVIVNHRKAQYTIAASTGAPATPTITGHYSVYRKDAGYNSEGMYYSSYWHNGYAVHGYASVPTFNASHGCVRIPIPDAIFVYNRLPIGTSVDTYY
jgi:hypothetical protein